MGFPDNVGSFISLREGLIGNLAVIAVWASSVKQYHRATLYTTVSSELLLLIFAHILLGSCEGAQKIGQDREVSSLLSTNDMNLSLFSFGRSFSGTFPFVFPLTR